MSGATSRASQPFLLGCPRLRGWDPPVSDPVLGALCLLPLPVLPVCFQVLQTRPWLLVGLPPRTPSSCGPSGSTFQVSLWEHCRGVA